LTRYAQSFQGRVATLYVWSELGILRVTSRVRKNR